MNNTNKRFLAFVVAGVLLATILVGGLVAVFSTINSKSTDSPISGLTISTPKDNSLEVGQKFQLGVEGTSVTGQSRTVDSKVDWVSVDKAIATIDENGVVTALAQGTATIQASLGGITAEAKLTTWNRASESVTGVISGVTNVKKGETTQLTATFPNVNNPETFWSSDNVTVATVDNDGLVTGLAGGTATITARVSDTNIVAKAIITVVGEGQVSEIKLNIPSELPLGTVQKIQYDLLPAGVTADVVFEASNANATIANGVLTTLNAGYVTITARVGTVTATAVVNIVDVPVTSLTIQGSETTTVGEIVTLNVVASPSNALQVADWTYTFVDPNTRVASFVDEDGNQIMAPTNAGTVYLEALAEGQIKLVATRTNTDKSKVESKEFVLTIGARKDVTKVIIDRDSRFVGDTLTVVAGADITVSASVLPASANPNLRWLTNNQTVAYLNTQVDTPTITITPLTSGEAIITARAYNKDGSTFEDSIKLIVTSYANITEVNINGEVKAKKIRVVKGATVQLDGTTKVDNVPSAIRYQSKNTPIATVDANTGKVTAISLGVATIEARVEGRDDIAYASIEIEVIATPDATSIAINGADVVPSGTRSKYTVTATPTGVEQNVTWSRVANGANSVLNTGVKTEFITVDANGNETINSTTAKGEVATIRFTRDRDNNDNVIGTGIVTLTATHTNTDGTTIKTTHEVKVSPEPTATAIEITGQAEIGAEIVELLATASVKGDAVLSEGVRQHFVWRSLNEDIAVIGTDATVNNPITGQTQYAPNGTNTHLDTIYVKGLNSGIATIVAEIPNTELRAEYKVKVTVANASVKSVTVLAKGTDYATVDLPDKSGAFDGKIDNAEIKAVAQANLYEGGSIELEATGWSTTDRAYATDKVNNVSFYWWSNNEHIATVDQNGVVTQVSGMSGKVTIYAEAIGTTLHNNALGFEINVDASRNQRIVDFVNNYGFGGSKALVGSTNKLLSLGTTQTDANIQKHINFIQARIDILVIKKEGIDTSKETEYNAIATALTPSAAPNSINGIIQLLFLPANASSTTTVFDLIAEAIINPSQNNADAVNDAIKNYTLIPGFNEIVNPFLNVINA